MNIIKDPRTDTEFAMRFRNGQSVVLGLTDIPPDVETIHFVDASKDFEQLLEYPTVSAISINNITMTAQARRALQVASPQLARLQWLQVWNCAKFDLELLSLFPAVQFLQLAHRNARGNDWSQLSLLPRLNGLFLVDATGMADLGFCAHIGGKLSTLSVLGARSLKTTAGVEHLSGSLMNLALWGGREHPSRKRLGPIKLSAIEALKRLQSLSVSGLEFDTAELGKVVRKLKRLAELELDPWQFEMSTYAQLRMMLPNVQSAALQPFVDAGDSLLPVGKGTKTLQRSSANFNEQYARYLMSWKDASRAGGPSIV